ncbi:FAD:protein FMN transferase [Sphingosinithalassobacter tenebrarum]|uniref:FAD:protein FMN transferase n=2 Tax=Stakelama tenebrarum TaxID=2711215 RepID=A0A6G6YA25_9SPHN|nr:FAD:protein FMN transferase [Sphingosinithalassobacter tenebrarum]
MGTRWSARIAAPEDGLSQDTQRAIERTLAGVNAEMSHWDRGSDISRVNHSPVYEWQPLPPAFSHVLGAAMDVARRSGGSFDPAMGRLSDLWGFGPSGPREGIPEDADIAKALAASGVAGVEYDKPLLRVRRSRPVWFDFSGIAKGYAVDALAAALRALGLTDFLVEIGGELVGEGIRPDGQPWWVDIEMPPDVAVAPLRVALHGIAVATSGDYMRSIEHDGRRYAHTIDPRSGAPIDSGVRSVTVLHRECMLADAWATALTVLGPDGMTLAERESLAVQMVIGRGTMVSERISPALEAMLSD